MLPSDGWINRPLRLVTRGHRLEPGLRRLGGTARKNPVLAPEKPAANSADGCRSLAPFVLRAHLRRSVGRSIAASPLDGPSKKDFFLAYPGMLLIIKERK
jgi:hypothetical protein